MKLDLNNAKIWSPTRELVRFYFDNAFIQVVAKGYSVYYKFNGIEEPENMDEVLSQISYFCNVKLANIYPSKF